MRPLKVLVCAALLSGPAIPAFAAPLAGDAAAVPLAAHRAVYDLTLGQVKGSRAPVAATGRIAYEFIGSACEGYSTTFRQFTELQPPEGESRASDMRSATFESGDGKDFRFRVTTSVEGDETRLDGTARKADDGALSIRLTQPAPAQVDLDHDALFPTAHMEHVIAAARAGERTYSTKVFDGSDTGRKVYETMAVIGPPLAGEPEEEAARDKALKGMKRWPVAISFFDAGKFDAPPNYVLSFDLYENGVSRALKLDYGDFIIEGTLTKFEALAGKGCP